MVTTAPGLANAQEPLPAGLVVFGQELAGRLNGGEDMTPFLAPQPATCQDPRGGPMTTDGVCEGLAAGTVVSGCLAGRFGSDAGYVNCERTGAVLAAVGASQFEGREIQLYAASPDGRTAGVLACPECARLIYSTPLDVVTTATKGLNLLELQLVQTNGEWRIYSHTVGIVRGDGATAVVNGGTFEGQRYIAISQISPPATGSGVRAADGSLDAWKQARAELLAVAAMAIGSAALAWVRRRIA